MKNLNLVEYTDKCAGTLSGGNKRKLSVAMALLGNPAVILLDEPSAGMDPEARRFMWQVVAKVSQQQKTSGVIITTHSMEEAEALSTKMGIQVKGGVFRCFGSSQHIKNKFATGYEIEAKFMTLTEEEVYLTKLLLGLKEEQETIQLDEFMKILETLKCDEYLLKELSPEGFGSELVRDQEDDG
jgi:ATP-binding cassette subfamily A (ABC1) protein 3